MGNLKGLMTSGLIFYALIILIVNFWGGFTESYDIGEQENLRDGMTIFQKLQTLNLIAGINRLQTGIFKLTTINPGQFDILGGLATSAIGVLQTIGGMVTFPLEIFGVIAGTRTFVGFYPTLIPEIIPTILGLSIVVFLSILLISAKLGFDLRP